MAKIQKMDYFAKKIVHKYILGYILTLWIWLSLIMASQLRNLCTEVKTHQNCDLAKNMAKYAKNGQNYTPLFFIWAHYGTQKVWNDFGNVKFFLSGFTWNHPLTKPPWQFWQNRVSNSRDIPDMDKCCQDKCCLYNCYSDSWILFQMFLEFGQNQVCNIWEVFLGVLLTLLPTGLSFPGCHGGGQNLPPQLKSHLGVLDSNSFIHALKAISN